MNGDLNFMVSTEGLSDKGDRSRGYGRLGHRREKSAAPRQQDGTRYT